MTKLSLLTISLTALLFASCGEHAIDCTDAQIRTAFINYATTDIDTFILRKYKAANNYQTLLDTFKVTEADPWQYRASNDTTTVSPLDYVHGITAGFDWQIFIPATNKTILISDIMTEKKTGKCRLAVFGKPPCGCLNPVYSAKINNQVVNFPDSTIYTIYIR